MAIEPRRINRELRGFLDLVRAKVGGRAPDAFEGIVRPTIDSIPWLSTAGLVTKSAFQTGTTAANVSIDVPSDEVWLVAQAMASVEVDSVVTAATQSCMGYLAFGNIPTAGGGGTADAMLGWYNWQATLVDTVSQVRAASYTYVPPTYFLLPPDATVKNVMDTKNGSLSITSRVYCLYTPFKI